MKGIKAGERWRISGLFLAPFFVFCSFFGTRATTKWIKTRELANCIERTDIKGAKRALAAGADPNGRAPGGWSMIMWAVGNNGNLDAVRELKKAGAKTDATEDLFIAVQRKDRRAAREALMRGADVNGLEKGNWTCLMEAAWLGDPSLVKLLLDFGADVTRVADGQSTAMDLSCQFYMIYGAQGDMAGCGPDAILNKSAKFISHSCELCSQTRSLLHKAEIDVRDSGR